MFIYSLPFLAGIFISVLLSLFPSLYLSPVISINLYQPGQVNEAIDFPEIWNELELPELEAISRVQLSDIEDQQPAKSVILLEIIKHRAKQKKIPIEIVQRLDPEDLARDGLALVDFIYKENMLTKQPYPTINLAPGTIMYGPASDFETLTAGEYESAEIFFLQFKETPEVCFLASMAAVLYRPAKTEFIKYRAEGDEYITYDYEKQVKHFAKLGPVVLFTIYMWYLGCRCMLPILFPTLHEGGSSNGATDLLVFTKCIHSAAGPKNGTRDRVRRTLLKALFFEMEEEAKKAKELKEQYERK